VRGSPLFLHVANIGRDPIHLKPGIDTIARIQFLDLGAAEEPSKALHSHWRDQRLASLGFLSDLKRLKEEVERNDVRSKDIMLFGVFVLAVALIGAELTTLLSLIGDRGLRHEIKVFVQGPGNIRWFWAAIAVGMPLLALALIWGTRELSRFIGPRWRRRRWLRRRR
jgi:hypothetical protein